MAKINKVTAGWKVAVLTLAVAAVPALAQAPDCTGISDVINTSPDLVGELTTVRVASGLFSPVFLTHAPGDNTRLFILEQAGRIRIVKNGVLLATSFLDIDAKTPGANERGLLGLAFHPDYQTNRFFFVYYTANDGAITIERYQRNLANPDLADLGSAMLVKSVGHPISNHNGGTVAFSPLDGHLYFALGDGGSGCDPGGGTGNAQTLTADLGKMHRLNVDSLPATTTGNPFDGATPGNDSIWAYGLRNPYRFSFDRVTGALYIGDVGQDVWEELDCSPASSVGGENYGWVNMEGDHCPNPSCGAQNPCPPVDYLAPVREYGLGPAALCSIIGGNVYRGCRMGALGGTYFYSDYCSGNTHDYIKTLRTDGTCSVSAGPDTEREPDLEAGGVVTIDSVVAFGEDNRGEVYIVDHDGDIFKIVPTLSIVELSGPNATPFLLGQNWTWENLQASSGIPIRFYRAYRSSSPQGPFTCIHKQISSSTTWIGGDPAVPAVGQVFYYLSLAENVAGEITHPGVGSGGTPRNVDNVTPCL